MSQNIKLRLASAVAKNVLKEFTKYNYLNEESQERLEHLIKDSVLNTKVPQQEHTEFDFKWGTIK